MDVLGQKGNFPKKSRRAGSARNPLHEGGGGTVLKVQNPLQQDLLGEDSDEPLSPRSPGGSDGNTADKQEEWDNKKSGYISTAVHRLEEVAVKDAHIVEGALKKDLKQLEQLVPEDLKILGDVGAH
eukprot:COSAG02_NODE_22929_length_735_cov_1.518868_1_plen_125_part_10